MRPEARNAVMMTLFSLIMLSMLSCGNDGRGSSTSGAGLQNIYGEGNVGEGNVREQTGVNNPLVGTWVAGKYTLTFDSVAYSVDFNHDSSPDNRGNYIMSGNLVIFTDSGGLKACINSATIGGGVSGYYTYAVSGNTLTLSLVYDQCNGRAASLGRAYTRK